jgi:hypothetical protein
MNPKTDRKYPKQMNTLEKHKTDEILLREKTEIDEKQSFKMNDQNRSMSNR